MPNWFGSFPREDKTLKPGTVGAQTSGLDARLPETVYKPDRGIFRLTEFRDNEAGDLKEELVPEPAKRTRETDFYQPFADWLVNETEVLPRRSDLVGTYLGVNGARQMSLENVNQS